MAYDPHHGRNPRKSPQNARNRGGGYQQSFGISEGLKNVLYATGGFTWRCWLEAWNGAVWPAVVVAILVLGTVTLKLS